jgi:hypothetical protein
MRALAKGGHQFTKDNGPEFVSKALLSWIAAQGIGTALIEPGKPWQKALRYLGPPRPGPLHPPPT